MYIKYNVVPRGICVDAISKHHNFRNSIKVYCRLLYCVYVHFVRPRFDRTNPLHATTSIYRANRFPCRVVFDFFPRPLSAIYAAAIHLYRYTVSPRLPKFFVLSSKNIIIIFSFASIEPMHCR